MDGAGAAYNYSYIFKYIIIGVLAAGNAACCHTQPLLLFCARRSKAERVVCARRAVPRHASPLIRPTLLVHGCGAGDMGVGKSCLLHQFTEKKCKLAIVLGVDAPCPLMKGGVPVKNQGGGQRW